MTHLQQFVEAVTTLASSLPSSTVQAVAEAIASCSQTQLRAEIAKRVPQHHQRSLVLAFLDSWQDSSVEPSAVAFALLTAARTEQKHRASQSVELVWTGPDSNSNPVRRTEQSILQVLDSAHERITLVSFAVYSIPNIAAALVRAAKRGVVITVVVETPDKLGGENEYSTLQALGPEVETCSSVYYWPKEKRQLSESSKPGILHVKCAVADGIWLFLSSANFTQQAFTVNMELGLLLKGGTIPLEIEHRFQELIKSGTLAAANK